MSRMGASSTTTDPVRLLSDPSCPEGHRELLRHGIAIEPPRDAELQVWQALGGAIGAAVVGSAADAITRTTTTATKLEKAGLSGGKVLAIAAALVVLVAAAVYLVVSGRRTEPRQPAPVAALPAAEAPATEAPSRPAAGEPPAWDVPAPPADPKPARPAPGTRRAVRAQARPAAASGPSPAAAPTASRLVEETTLIRDARQALRQGDAARALRVLEECRRLFPAGVLEQERERLTIEALAKGGPARESSARAAEFLRRYPDSPHAREVRGLGAGAPVGR
jgi:hypothetical protein